MRNIDKLLNLAVEDITDLVFSDEEDIENDLVPKLLKPNLSPIKEEQSSRFNEPSSSSIIRAHPIGCIKPMPTNPDATANQGNPSLLNKFNFTKLSQQS